MMEMCLSLETNRRSFISLLLIFCFLSFGAHLCSSAKGKTLKVCTSDTVLFNAGLSYSINILLKPYECDQRNNITVRLPYSSTSSLDNFKYVFKYKMTLRDDQRLIFESVKNKNIRTLNLPFSNVISTSCNFTVFDMTFYGANDVRHGPKSSLSYIKTATSQISVEEKDSPKGTKNLLTVHVSDQVLFSTRFSFEIHIFMRPYECDREYNMTVRLPYQSRDINDYSFKSDHKITLQTDRKILVGNAKEGYTKTLSLPFSDIIASPCNYSVIDMTFYGVDDLRMESKYMAPVTDSNPPPKRNRKNNAREITVYALEPIIFSAYLKTTLNIFMKPFDCEREYNMSVSLPWYSSLASFTLDYEMTLLKNRKFQIAKNEGDTKTYNLPFSDIISSPCNLSVIDMLFYGVDMLRYKPKPTTTTPRPYRKTTTKSVWRDKYYTTEKPRRSENNVSYVYYIIPIALIGFAVILIIYCKNSLQKSTGIPTRAGDDYVPRQRRDRREINTVPIIHHLQNLNRDLDRDRFHQPSAPMLNVPPLSDQRRSPSNRSGTRSPQVNLDLPPSYTDQEGHLPTYEELFSENSDGKN